MRPIGDEKISDEALTTMRERGGTWAVYQNVALDSAGVGHLKFLQVGPENTFKEPPKRLPDTKTEINWKYWHVGFVDLSTGVISP